ncbi:MAG: hypothetical protein DCF16_03785 [Alphaproteobacteria bacterium]|nr:MAG: hypothetical protein DCF16_03785 [Alphaproteobacteria bacterium]
MNWEAAAAIAEITAALGVVVSLIYLANQARREARETAVANKLASTKLLTDFIDALIANPELMDLWMRARIGAETLSEVERYRFSNMCMKAFWFFSASHFQLRMKTLTDEDWAEVHAVLRFWLDGPGVRAWWKNGARMRFAGAFVAFIDGEIEKIAATDSAAA